MHKELASLAIENPILKTIKKKTKIRATIVGDFGSLSLLRKFQKWVQSTYLRDTSCLKG